MQSGMGIPAVVMRFRSVDPVDGNPADPQSPPTTGFHITGW